MILSLHRLLQWSVVFVQSPAGETPLECAFTKKNSVVMYLEQKEKGKRKVVMGGRGEMGGHRQKEEN